VPPFKQKANYSLVVAAEFFTDEKDRKSKDSR